MHVVGLHRLDTAATVELGSYDRPSATQTHLSIPTFAENCNRPAAKEVRRRIGGKGHAYVTGQEGAGRR